MFGNIKNEAGLLFNKGNFKLVKKILNVLKGKMEMYLNETEKHVLVPGDILHFDGVNFINGSALEDSEVSVTLIKK